MMIEKIYKKLKEKIDRESSKDDYSKLIAVYEKPEYLFQEVLDLEGIEFGIEIEFESEMSENDIIKCLEKNGFPLEKMISKACSRNKKKNYQKWNFCRECCRNKDESLKCEKELISPIFKEEVETWKQIREVVNLIKIQLKGKINEVCSIHIHVNRKCFMKSPIAFNDLQKLYVYLEPLILCVAAGENREVSEERLFHYSAVASQDELFWRKSFKSANTAREEIGNASNFDENINNLINQFFSSRYHSINYSTKTTDYLTVEFRIFNGTLNENIIQTYLVIIDHILQNIGEITEKIDPYYDKNGEYYLNSNYVKKCFDLLGFNNREKSAVLDILKKNNFYIPQHAIRALEGHYTDEEIQRIV